MIKYKNVTKIHDRKVLSDEEIFGSDFGGNEAGV